MSENWKRDWAILGAILLGALGLRLLWLSPQGLWYDEIHSTTYAILPLRQTLLAVQRIDPHPPLYYLQLHFWMLVNTGDVWIKLNSVMWSLLTGLSLFLIGRRIYGRVPALLAVFIFALMPLAVLYAQNVRMYAMLMYVAVWAWYFTHQFLMNGSTWPRILGIIGGISLTGAFIGAGVGTRRGRAV